MRNTTNRRRALALTQGLLLIVFAPFAAAYIGPGSGISVIGSLLALLATVGLAFLAIVMFPFRKMMKKRAEEEADHEGEENEIAVSKKNTESS